MISGSKTTATNCTQRNFTNNIPKKNNNNPMPDKHKIKSNATPLYCIWLCEKAPWGFVWGKIRSLQYKTRRLQYKATPCAHI